MNKILQQIEDIVGDDFCMDMDSNLDKIEDWKLKECIKKLGKVYMIAHANNKDHSCYSVHNDWRDEKTR